MTKERKFQIEQLLEASQALLHKEQISEQVSGKTILVTGAAGSIGSEVAKQLLLYVPKKILLFDVAEMPLNKLCLKLEGIQKETELVPYLADIKDENLMQNLFATHQPEIVYHAAANKYVPLLEGFPYQAIQNNVLGTKIIADLSNVFQVKTFVFISTDKAVNPSSVMGASKRIAEQYIQSVNQESATGFIVTRFGNVFGSSGSVGPIFSRQIKAGGPLTITHPEMERYFMTTTQACELVLESGAMGIGGEIFMFDMGTPIRIIDLAHQMISAAGLVPEEDIKIEWIGLRPGEKLQEDLTTQNDVLLETNHPQIKKVQTLHKNLDAKQDVKEINDFLFRLSTMQEIEIVKEMKRIVPEFKSNHSIHSALD